MSRRIFKQILIVSLSVFAVATLPLLCYFLSSFKALAEIGASSEMAAELTAEVTKNLIILSILTAAVAAVLTVLHASRAAKMITDPISRIDFDDPKGSNIYPELDPLTDRIISQDTQITRQINDLREEHKKQDEMRRDFTANVSHELKTPLTSISGYAELIQKGIAQENDIPRFAGKIYDESQRLITLVGDIIKLSRLEDDEVEPRMSNVDLYEVCSGVVDQLEMAAMEKDVSMKITGEHIVIKSAEGIVNEIVFNLCDNAVKYNKPGGSVDIAIKQYADGVELSVCDTGIGIPAENLDRIFERFYRVDKSHSKEIGGTGLGLSIVKHGAIMIGAHIDVQSTVGKGTTVKVLF